MLAKRFIVMNKQTLSTEEEDYYVYFSEDELGLEINLIKEEWISMGRPKIISLTVEPGNTFSRPWISSHA